MGGYAHGSLVGSHRVSASGHRAPPPALAAAAQAARTRHLLEAPILPTILRLAAPNVVMVLVQAASSTLDALFVGRLGTEPLAGVSLVLPAWMFMVTASGGAFGNSVASAIARALGSGRRDDAEALVRHAMLLALGGALTFSAALLGGGRWLYGAMGGTGATLDAALAYSNLVFAGAVAVWLVNALLAVLRGTGQMLIPAVVVVGGELVHLALAPTLIFGLGPAPALGVAGAALSLLTPTSCGRSRWRASSAPAARRSRCASAAPCDAPCSRTSCASPCRASPTRSRST